VNKRLREGSLVVFDKGVNSVDNIGLILSDHMKYLTSRKLNASNDKKIATSWKHYPLLIDSKKSLLNLTVTVDKVKGQAKKYIYANFDDINKVILRPKWSKSGI
jgi:transposase